MSSKQRRLILIAILIIFVTLTNSNSDRCYTIYTCCKKIDLDCVEYCEPFLECPDEKFEEERVLDQNLVGEGINKTLNGTGTQILNVSMCRRGTKLVNGICKKVF